MTPRRASFLAVALTAVVLLCAGAAGAAGAPPATEVPAKPEATQLVVIVSPSRLARHAAFDHLIAVVQGIEMPRVVVVGMWEQKSADDGVAWNRPFLLTESPDEPPAPALSTPTTSCRGTTFQHAQCMSAADRASKTNEDALARWRVRWAAELAQWQSEVVDRLSSIRDSGPTEESQSGTWDLAAALLKAGQTFAAMPPGRRVILLLGGLAVQLPPGYLSTKLLAGVQIVAAGWNGTTAEQQTWVSRLAGDHASISFVPSQVTELLLAARVSSALGESGSEAR